MPSKEQLWIKKVGMLAGAVPPPEESALITIECRVNIHSRYGQLLILISLLLGALHS